MCHENKRELSEGRNRTSEREKRDMGEDSGGANVDKALSYENTTKILRSGGGSGGSREASGHNNTRSHNFSWSLCFPPASTLGASDTSEVDPDFGKRFASRCTEDAGRFREFLHCLLNLLQLQWTRRVQLAEPKEEK